MTTSSLFDSHMINTAGSLNPPKDQASGASSLDDAGHSHALLILRFLQEEAMTRFPAFPEVFGQLVPIPCPDMESPLGTDGVHLSFNPPLLCESFLENAEHLRRSYLHVHIHCLCFHMVQSSSMRQEKWDMACDLSAELMADLLLNQKTVSEKLLDLLPANEAEHICSMLRRRRFLDADTIAAILNLTPKLTDFAKECAHDSHRGWFRSLYSPSAAAIGGEGLCNGKSPSGHRSLSPEQLEHLEALQKRWDKKLPKVRQAAGTGRKNGSGGTVSEDADLKRRDSMDYHRFLSRFSIPGEEALLDMDAFDYIPYYYGLACYADEIAAYGPAASPFFAKGIPFIEPLEYREVNRLDELAIAIDTSGSCSGKIVRRFLEETWNILSQKENFFAKMRLHLIQCDSMIQEHRIFTSIEEWEAALPDLKILGHGNTDFRPVFEHLEKLIQKKEIRRLRGLLYFTDGDGIFPPTAPPWDTAFVFLNDHTEKHEIPDWAIRLNLHLPDDF